MNVVYMYLQAIKIDSSVVSYQNIICQHLLLSSLSYSLVFRKHHSLNFDTNKREIRNNKSNTPQRQVKAYFPWENDLKIILVKFRFKIHYRCCQYYRKINFLKVFEINRANNTKKKFYSFQGYCIIKLPGGDSEAIFNEINEKVLKISSLRKNTLT